MPKLLIRVVAVLLIPCLLGDSYAFSAGPMTQPTRVHPVRLVSPPFSQQALVPAAAAALFSHSIDPHAFSGVYHGLLSFLAGNELLVLGGGIALGMAVQTRKVPRAPKGVPRALNPTTQFAANLKVLSEKLFKAYDTGDFSQFEWARTKSGILQKIVEVNPGADDGVHHIMASGLKSLPGSDITDPLYFILQAYGLAVLGHSSTADFDDVARRIERYNTLARDKKFKPHAGPLSLGHLLVSALATYVDDQWYMSYSHRLTQIPQPFLREVLIADALYSGNHETQSSVDRADALAIAPTLQRLIELVKEDPADEELHTALARLAVGLLTVDDVTDLEDTELIMAKNKDFLLQILASQIQKEKIGNHFSAIGLSWLFGNEFPIEVPEIQNLTVPFVQFLLHPELSPELESVIREKLRPNKIIRYKSNYLPLMRRAVKNLRSLDAIHENDGAALYWSKRLWMMPLWLIPAAGLIGAMSSDVHSGIFAASIMGWFLPFTIKRRVDFLKEVDQKFVPGEASRVSRSEVKPDALRAFELDERPIGEEVNLPGAPMRWLDTIRHPQLGDVFKVREGEFVLARAAAGQKIALFSSDYQICTACSIHATDSIGHRWIGHAHLNPSFDDFDSDSYVDSVPVPGLKGGPFYKLMRVVSYLRAEGFSKIQLQLAIDSESLVGLPPLNQLKEALGHLGISVLPIHERGKGQSLMTLATPQGVASAWGQARSAENNDVVRWPMQQSVNKSNGQIKDLGAFAVVMSFLAAHIGLGLTLTLSTILLAIIVKPQWFSRPVRKHNLTLRAA